MNIASFFQRDINWTAVGKSSALTPEIREHLSKVYTTLAIAVLTSAIGCYVEMRTHMFAGILALLGVIGLIVWMSMISRVQIAQRFIVLLGIAFLQGSLLGPMVERTINIDPSIVVTAFIGTTVIFACFTGMSLFAVRRSYLYLSGILSSGLSLMCMISFMNIFFRSAAAVNFQLYFGLMIFCGFIIFDTQLIIEKRFLGDKDFVGHALELFLDFVNVFVRLLAILSKNKQQEKKNNNNRR